MLDYCLPDEKNVFSTAVISSSAAQGKKPLPAEEVAPVVQRLVNETKGDPAKVHRLVLRTRNRHFNRASRALLDLYRHSPIRWLEVSHSQLDRETAKRLLDYARQWKELQVLTLRISKLDGHDWAFRLMDADILSRTRILSLHLQDKDAPKQVWSNLVHVSQNLREKDIFHLDVWVENTPLSDTAIASIAKVKCGVKSLTATCTAAQTLALLTAIADEEATRTTTTLTRVHLDTCTVPTDLERWPSSLRLHSLLLSNASYPFCCDFKKRYPEVFLTVLQPTDVPPGWDLDGVAFKTVPTELAGIQRIVKENILGIGSDTPDADVLMAETEKQVRSTSLVRVPSKSDQLLLFAATYRVVPGCEVKQTDLTKGRGLFVTRDYDTGEYITEYAGDVISHIAAQTIRENDRANHTQEGAYLRSLVPLHEVINGLKDPEVGRGMGSFANDAYGRDGWKRNEEAQHNAEFEVVTPARGVTTRIFLRARRPLRAGTQVLVYYGSDYEYFPARAART